MMLRVLQNVGQPVTAGLGMADATAWEKQEPPCGGHPRVPPYGTPGPCSSDPTA